MIKNMYLDSLNGYYIPRERNDDTPSRHEMPSPLLHLMKAYHHHEVLLSSF